MSPLLLVVVYVNIVNVGIFHLFCLPIKNIEMMKEKHVNMYEDERRTMDTQLNYWTNTLFFIFIIANVRLLWVTVFFYNIRLLRELI